jgi:hypothetical protein
VPVKLEHKVYQVLAYLVQHRERLVARDELLEHVWPGVYVAEAAVTRCIAALRQAVGDDRARTLCAQVGDTLQLFPALLGLSRFYLTRGPLSTARELGQQLYRLAQHEGTRMRRLEACAALGDTLFFLGEFAAAWAHLEQGIALTDPLTERAAALRHGVAPGVRCLVVAANTLWCLGTPAQAVRRSQEALALARELAHPQSLAMVHHFIAFLHYHRREAVAVQAQADTLLTLATAQELPLWVGHGTCWRGWSLAIQGQGEAGMTQLRQGLAAVLATGQTLTQPLHLVLLAEAAGQAGQVEVGLHLLAEALTAFGASGRSRPAGRGTSPPGRLAAAAGRPGYSPGRSLLPAGPGHSPPPAGQVLGAARGHEPEPPVAAAGQGQRRPRAAGPDLRLVHRGLRYRRSTRGQALLEALGEGEAP